MAACEHRQPAAPWLVMRVITTFMELSNPFPHHSIIHGIFTIYLTHLTMNISQIHISCTQKGITDHISARGAHDHLEHLSAQNNM
jgi:hypothetical protein